MENAYAVCQLVGCSKNSEGSVVRNLTKKINNISAYKIDGELELVNNDEVYTYDISVSYKKDNYYLVSLTNLANNSNQVILKNGEGVFVITPALNKSFKFQSDWPYDNSQIYLLEALMKDIKNSTNRSFKTLDNGYMITTSVNYPNNPKLVKENIILDNNSNIKEVKVYDNNESICMSMKFKNIDYSPTFKDNYFSIDSIMSDKATTTSTGNLDSSIYPLVLPEGTKLVSEEHIKKDDGERILLTFGGEKPFLLVEEDATVFEENTIIPTYGEPYQLMDTLGVMTDNSLSWSSNGIEYYLVSDVLETDELLEVASSINVLPTMK